MANGGPQGFHICTAVSGVCPRSTLPGKLEIAWFSTCPSRALHRSGAALIAIADSVAAPMFEAADHDGAQCPRPHATASSDRKSRRCSGRLPSSKHGVSILQLWCTLSDACRWSTCIEPNFWDHGGQHGQESEEGKEDSQEDSQEEKEVVVRRKPHCIRIASEVRSALRSTDRWQLSPTEYPRNKH